MKRKVISTALAAAMLLSMAAPAYAQETDQVTQAATLPADEVGETAEEELPSYNDAEVPINEDTFPDETFRKFVLDRFDSDDSNSLSAKEISKATDIAIYKDVTSLKGIEYLTSLKVLYCLNCQLTSLDVSKNVALTNLECYGNQLTALDVSNNTALGTLKCNNNKLTTLDVSNNPNLWTLCCGGNQLVSLTLSKTETSRMHILECESNQLTSLDVSKYDSLSTLRCSGNRLTSLDVSKNTALKMLYCHSNQLTDLDLSKNGALEWLTCSNNQLTSLDVRNNTLLEYPLECNDNKLTSLYLGKNDSLNAIQCYNNQLTTLDVSGCTSLLGLYCYNNQLAALDVSDNKELKYLCCQENCLPTLDLQNNTKLSYGTRSANNMDYVTLSPQHIKESVAGAEFDAASLVGQENLSRVSDIQYSTGSVTYCYDVKGRYSNGNTISKMTVTVDNSAATPTPVPQTTANPDQPQSTATPTPTTPAAPTEPDATPVPTTPANPDDNNGTGDNDDNNTETPATPDTTGVEGFVDRLYSVCLGRPADAAGKADWVGQLTSYQISGTKAAYGFIFSQEFTNMNYSNADFVEHLYEAFMGRASDEGGKADWVSKLDAGTSREEVFSGFANSVEFDNICKSYGIVSKDIETFVTRLYSVCLDRQPDDSGLADWANQLRSQTISGKAAASGFVFSEEFTNKNYSNADYVEHLYAAFMGRASDEAGKADWVSKLDAGTSREEVFNGFADSAEFDNICSSYGIVRG